MSNTIQPRVLKGFRDSLPEIEVPRKQMIKKVVGQFEKFAFLPIDTPALEYTEILLGKGGGETDKQIYRFQDHGKRDVALRFDLTVPFARFMAQHQNELYLPFRRYHIGSVWRGENTQKGRYREFTQCDFDIVGTDSLSADFDVLNLMTCCFEALGLPKLSIRISNRAIFNRFLQKMELEEKSEDILRIVDKLAKIGQEKVGQELQLICGNDNAEKVLEYIKQEESFEANLDKMIDLAGGDAEDSRRLREIQGLFKSIGKEGLLELDPSITRGLDYYTGIVFETFLEALPNIGSVCSGGRYNNLASVYSKKPMPGVGGSIGLDRLIAALEELESPLISYQGPDLVLLQMDSHLLPYYHRLAARFRAEGISCEVFPEKKKIAQQFSYAEKKQIPFALICGEFEVQDDCVNLKNLESKQSHEKISLAKAIKIIQEAKKEGNSAS